MGTIYKFSYDDKEDAIKSLANYYSISVDTLKSKIIDVYNYIENLKSDDFYSEYFDNGMMLVNIGYLLNPNLCELENSKIHISFYHRCASDGKDNWFKEGLLNSVDGIECFWHKLVSLVPDIEEIGISLESLKKRIRRKGFDEEQSEKDGINGFYRYKDAIDKENSGFNIPEVFDDLCKGESYQKLKSKILTVLKPTVVKFYVERDITELNNILRYYWELVGNDEDVGQTATNVGRGKTIPYENIERIDYLEKVLNA
jgi:hypothetical protein